MYIHVYECVCVCLCCVYLCVCVCAGSQGAGAFAGFTFSETRKGDTCLPAAADAMLTGGCEDSQASTFALTCPVRQWSPPTQTT